MSHKKGFTLIETLMVIAIIAVLVSIVIPLVTNGTEKASAATDAANLRTVLSMLNVDVVNGQKTVQEVMYVAPNPVSKVDPDAVLYAVFDAPGFIDVYYVNESTNTYYGLSYLSQVASYGESAYPTTKPDIAGNWYKAGVAPTDP